MLGRTIELNGTTFTIVGIAPPEFFGTEVGEAPDIWVSALFSCTLICVPSLYAVVRALPFTLHYGTRNEATPRDRNRRGACFPLR